MRIGVVSIGYQCNTYLDKVFAPWAEIKKGALKDKIENLWIGTAHACFVETFVAGYPRTSTDGTLEVFRKYHEEGIIDQLTIFENPEYEFSVWSSNLKFLFNKGVDVIFMLNSDEIWTVEEISRLVDYVNEHPEADYFKIVFKNYVFNFNTYITDFIVPRIWRVNRNGGFGKFHFDDEVVFLNGKTDKEVPHLVVPEGVVFPKHYSWVGSKEYLQRKLKFQKIHYGRSSYKWNDEKDCLDFDLEYYRMFNKQVPELHYDTKP